jgi:hypothetical protein
MKRKLLLIAICLIVGFVIGDSFGYHRGKRDSSIENFEVYDIWLTSYYGYSKYKGFPLVDFLKARYYYFANRIPGSAFNGHDYGNINFTGPAIGSDMTSPSYEYQVFKRKHADAKMYPTNQIELDMPTNSAHGANER